MTFERSIFLKLLDSNCVMICLESTVEIYQYHTIDLAAPNQEITIIKWVSDSLFSLSLFLILQK